MKKEIQSQEHTNSLSQADKITHIIINCQVLNNRLFDEIANKAFRQTLKVKAKVFLDELIKVEHELFNQFFDSKEESTVQVYKVYDNFMQKISKIPIWEMENIGHILDAYEKDPKSIEGITKKILK